MSEWRNVHRKTKVLHSVGRTVPRLRSSVPAEEADALREEMGNPGLGGFGQRDWGFLSMSQRLDLLATEILRKDRRRLEADAVVLIEERKRKGLPPLTFLSVSNGRSGRKAARQPSSPRRIAALEHSFFSEEQFLKCSQRELPWPEDALDYIALMMRVHGRHSVLNILDAPTGGMGLRRSYRWVGFRDGYVDRVAELRA